MFSLVKKIRKQVSLWRQLFSRLDQIEATVQRHEALAKENEALWTFLDEEDEEILRSATYCGPRRDIYAGTPEEIAEQISDEVLRTMKTQGDA
jgi:alkanesulfonate monooxygenase SsuD/methylene tetrahydromethanopterin reductase-like flavin-dependent oxidoreductase (luciferase family)